MLAKIDVILDSINLDQKMGSVFHGFIMESIDTDYAAYLHVNGDKPYSQYLYLDRKKKAYVWRISTLTEEAYEKIILKIKKHKYIYIKYKDITVKIHDVLEYETTDAEKLIDGIYLNTDKISKNLKIKFMSPTSFRSKGYYENYPNAFLIYNSLIRKMNTFSDKVRVGNEEVAAHLGAQTWMPEYSLRSVNYNVGKGKINSFIGRVCLNIKADDEIKKLALLLVKYGEYSGVGIKTSLGMGGITIE